MTKGNVVYLLKCSAKLGVKRNPAKTYQLCFESLQSNSEERKEEEFE